MTGVEKKELQLSFGNAFVDAANSIPWTADLHRMDIPKKFPLFVQLIKGLNIHLRRKIDYMWVRKFRVISCRSLDVSGSDHLPVVAELVIL
ncbi:hypothetical protein HY310_02395 [Candidatus Microgenomates bacterium]|nr:hypothetical protein [Candidatus Microgenomates bacterium]